MVSRLFHPLCLVLLVAAVALPRPGMAQTDSAQSVDGGNGSPAALADVLENEQARQRLVETLRNMAAQSGPPADGAGVAAAEQSSLPERLAAGSRAVAEQVVGEFGTAVEAMAALGTGPAIDWDGFGAAALELGALIVATVLVFVGLRRAVRPLFARAGRWAAEDSGGAALLRRTGAVVLAAAVDGLNILLAWVTGWALAAFVLGDGGVVEPRLSLFLNAFVVIEILKALIRVVFAARNDALRLLPIAAESAAYWNAWLSHLASFVGYGLLLVVPVVSAELSPALANLVYVVVVACGFVYALSIILQNRARVRERLEALSREAEGATARMMAILLARLWHLAAIAYLIGLTAVLLTRSESALPFMGAATLQSLLTIGLGVLLAAVIGRGISRGIRVPAATAAKFPTLELRLNQFVPRGLQAIRLVIVVLVAALLLDAWHLFDLRTWLGSDAGIMVVTSLMSVLAILALSAAAWIVVASWIDHLLNVETGEDEPSARHKTLLALFRNAAAVVIITMALMITLSELGINIGPLIAGAGVLGLAIGFGAQKLVQDIIGGVFIQLENAVHAGDWVTAGGISGTAERLSIRSVGLRDLEGTFHIVPFSSVDTVSNYNRDFAFHIGYYNVAYREDTDEVIKHLLAAFDELQQDPVLSEYIDGDLTVDGVSALADSAVNLRIRIRTKASYQWMVGRGYNRLVKRHFDAAGIEIPFPHRTLYFGQDKDGTAPPAHVRRIEGPDSGDAVPAEA